MIVELTRIIATITIIIGLSLFIFCGLALINPKVMNWYSKKCGDLK